uniref:Uncharacterized protein n=1 Tax=Anopheles farauti TaxID=69004 RepID=A0A182Q2A4_9DIPT
MANKSRFGTKRRISVALIVAICLCLKQVKGSCLSYGHSCWGAHGKRAGPPGRAAPSDGQGMVQYKPQQLLDQSNPLPAALTATERWALVRVLPEKNAYYPFSKLMHSPPATTSLLFNDDLPSSGSDTSRIALDAVNSPVRKLAETNHDFKTLTSTEQDLAVGDDRYLTADVAPIGHRRDHRHKKKPQTATTNHRYGGFDDSFEENASTDRMIPPNDDDMSQILLLNAVAAAAMSENDANTAGTQFNRKLFSARNSIPLNA